MVELLIGIMVLVILISFGVPSFNNAVLSGRLNGFAGELYGSMQLARSEAVKRNALVSLCTSSDGTECDADADWQDGWVVILGDGTVLQARDALPERFVIDEVDAKDTLTFSPTLAGSTSGVFTVCRGDPVGREERVVTLNATGAATVKRTEDGACP
jgi:type IV fimbrial biogenesis protein FimT